jgi:hypothetical protein
LVFFNSNCQIYSFDHTTPSCSKIVVALRSPTPQSFNSIFQEPLIISDPIEGARPRFDSTCSDSEEKAETGEKEAIVNGMFTQLSNDMGTDDIIILILLSAV